MGETTTGLGQWRAAITAHKQCRTSPLMLYTSLLQPPGHSRPSFSRPVSTLTVVWLPIPPPPPLPKPCSTSWLLTLCLRIRRRRHLILPFMKQGSHSNIKFCFAIKVYYCKHCTATKSSCMLLMSWNHINWQ